MRLDGSVFSNSRRAGALLFLVLLTCYGYFFPRWADWNQNSRFDLVMALVDQHTTQIDAYVSNTGDYALYEGHFYSDKAPGLALLGTPVYAVFSRLVPASSVETRLAGYVGDGALGGTLNPGGTGITAEKLYTFIALTVTTFVSVALPSAVLGLVLFWLLGQFGIGLKARFAAVLAYGLATSAFPYANAFVGHQTVAFLLFAAFAVAFAIRRSYLGRNWLYVLGLLLGYAVITEYPTALIAAILGLYALAGIRQPVDTLVRVTLGAVPALLLLALHDLAAFGTPLPVGYFHSALWTDVHQTGLVSITYPHLDALLGVTVGVHRGLLFVSPFLLLAIPGYVSLWRDATRRLEFWVVLLSPLALLLFNASSAMWQGGFAVGPRYLVAALPFLGFAAGIGLVATWRVAVAQPLVVLAIAWSVFAVWSETIAGQSFPDYTQNPLFDLSLPLLARGDIARNAGMLLKLSGWWSLLPLVTSVLVCAVACSVRIGSARVRPLAGDLAHSPAGAVSR